MADAAARSPWAAADPRPGSRLLAWSVIAFGVVPPLVVTRGFVDPFHVGKLAVCLLVGAVVAAALAVRILRGSPLLLPPRPLLASLAALVGTLVIATATSPHPLRSVVGTYERYGGLALYAACLVVFVAASSVLSHRRARTLAMVLVAGAVPVLAYGLAQWQGVDPLGWRATVPGPQVFATLGNTNFLSGWAAIVATLAAWGAADGPTEIAGRIGCGAAAVAAVTLTIVSGAQQGVVAAAAGLSLFFAVWLSTPGTALFHRRQLVGRAAWATASAGAIAVAWGIGPFGGARMSVLLSTGARLGKWEAAVRMALDRPVTGVGLDLFGDWYHHHRPLWEAVERGIHPTSNAAHNVPLQLLAGGGVTLGLAYAAMVAGVGVLLVRGLRRAQGEHRLLLAGFGGAWLAYHVQALVSIDLPHLAGLHWLLAAAIVALSGSDLPAVRRRGVVGLAAVGLLVTATALLVVAGSVLAADRAGGAAVRLDQQLRYTESNEASAMALRAAPWEPRHALSDARRRARRGDVDGAIRSYQTARDRQPRGIIQTVELARLAAARGRPTLASEAYEAALHIDPIAPALLAEVGRFELREGQAESARQRLERAVAADGGVPAWWADLARAREAAGDRAGAEEARERAAGPGRQPPEDRLHQPAPSP